MAGPPRGAKPAEWRSHYGGQSRPNEGHIMGGKAGQMAVAQRGQEDRTMDRFVGFDIHKIVTEKPFFETFIPKSLEKDFRKEWTLLLRRKPRALDDVNNSKVLEFGKLLNGLTQEHRNSIVNELNNYYMELFDNSELDTFQDPVGCYKKCVKNLTQKI